MLETNTGFSGKKALAWNSMALRTVNKTAMASAWSGDRKSENKCTLFRTAWCRNDFRSRVPKCFRKWLWLILFPISCSVHATFIKINICRRHLGGGQGRAPSKGNRYARELRTPKKNISFHRRGQKEQWVLGRRRMCEFQSFSSVFSQFLLLFTV